jgi:hypothetical protein
MKDKELISISSELNLDKVIQALYSEFSCFGYDFIKCHDNCIEVVSRLGRSLNSSDIADFCENYLRGYLDGINNKYDLR